MTVQSKELSYFYRAYKEWLDDGSPDGQPFWRDVGLCDNTKVLEVGFELMSKLYTEMNLQFYNEKLDTLFPFGENNFEVRYENNTQYLDPLRIKWVEDHLKPEFTGEN